MRWTIPMAAALFGALSAANAEEAPVRFGILMGFTGPVESLTPDMAAAARLAFDEASASGRFLGGRTIEAVLADSTCTDAAAAVASAERLVDREEVVAIVGAACSGTTGAAARNVTLPRGVVMISPSATSPGLSGLSTDDFFFRTAPSDARQGEVLAETLADHGIFEIAVTYTNNDYGKGLADAFSGAFARLGGAVSVVVPHEDGKADYTAEVATLSAAGSDQLLVIGYVDQGGLQIVRTALDLGAFDKFVFPDGMIGESVLNAAAGELEGSIGIMPGTDGPGASAFDALAEGAGLGGSGPYWGESYDAAALLVLAAQAAGSTETAALARTLRAVANAPGTEIGAGELAKGLDILSQGGDIDYVGATDIEFSDLGDTLGGFRELAIEDNAFTPVKLR